MPDTQTAIQADVYGNLSFVEKSFRQWTSLHIISHGNIITLNHENIRERAAIYRPITEKNASVACEHIFHKLAGLRRSRIFPYFDTDMVSESATESDVRLFEEELYLKRGESPLKKQITYLHGTFLLIFTRKRNEEHQYTWDIKEIGDQYWDRILNLLNVVSDKLKDEFEQVHKDQKVDEELLLAKNVLSEPAAVNSQKFDKPDKYVGRLERLGKMPAGKSKKEVARLKKNTDEINKQVCALNACGSLVDEFDIQTEKAYKNLIFKDKNPTKSRMNRFLADFAGVSLSNTTRETMNAAIHWCCDTHGWDLYYHKEKNGKGQVSTVTVKEMSRSEKTRFEVREKYKKGKKRMTFSAKPELPLLSVG